MSFLKIKNPEKRDFIVEEFLKSKKNIQNSFLSEKLGDLGVQKELTKFYRPILDSQSAQNALLSTIKDNSVATSSALKALPESITTSLKAIQFPQYPSIEAFEEPTEDKETVNLGDTATQYLTKYASDNKIVDTTFGIRSKQGKFYIGNAVVSFQGDDIKVGEKTYPGTPGLWELLTMTHPDGTIIIDDDRNNYGEILHETGAMCQQNNPTRPKSSKSYKYNKYVKPEWEKRVKTPSTSGNTPTKTGKTPSVSGQGIPVITIPSDPNELAKQLELRMYSHKAGNTGVRNEIVAICDELLRQNVLSKDEYKLLMLKL